MALDLARLRLAASSMFGVAVVLSVLGLMIGPVLVAWTRSTRVTFAALDGAILGIVPALVVLRLLPHLVEETGAWAVLSCAFGYLAFSAVETRTHRRAKNIGLAIVLPTLAVHGFLDGTGLALAFQNDEVLGAGGAAIGMALVVHKIPEGLFVASVLLPTLGPRRTAVRLLALAGATVLGALSGRELLDHASDRILHVAVALGLGVMLRMAIHRHDAPALDKSECLASGMAFVICLCMLLVVPDPQQLFSRSHPGELNALQTLAPLLLETAPWLLLALVVGEGVARWRRDDQRNADPCTIMWLPMIALSLPLLGLLLTLVRALLEPLVSLRPGLTKYKVGSEVQQVSAESSAGQPLKAWLFRHAAPRANRVLPSYVVGIALAIALESAVPPLAFGKVGWLALPLAALLAIVVRTGIPGATILVAVLMHKGLPLPAALVFTSVAAHVSSRGPTLASLRASLRALVTIGLAVLAALLLSPSLTPPLHALAAHPHPWTEWAAASVIAGWVLAQLVASGPRDWFGRLSPTGALHSG